MWCVSCGVCVWCVCVLRRVCVWCVCCVVLCVVCVVRVVSVVWYGVVWCGVVWCGVVDGWCGVVVWCGVVWCGGAFWQLLGGSTLVPTHPGPHWLCSSLLEEPHVWRRQRDATRVGDDQPPEQHHRAADERWFQKISGDGVQNNCLIDSFLLCVVTVHITGTRLVNCTVCLFVWVDSEGVQVKIRVLPLPSKLLGVEI